MIWCFFKLFKEERHADAFMSGSLYLNTLKHFKEMESEPDDGRADRTEAISHWLQPQGVTITLKAPGFDEILTTEKDLAGPISIAYNSYNTVHVLCLYAVHSDDAASPRHIGEQWTRQIQLDDRCLRLGKFAVIIPAKLFLDQLNDALRAQRYQARGKLVTYYDDALFNGELPEAEVPFMKQKRFDYQREFRLCIYPLVQTSEPLTVRIGDLSSFCRKLEASQLSRHWLAFRRLS